jgi:hypothetical protein
MNSTFPIEKFTLKVFLGINTNKGIGASLAGPQPGPIPISFHSFAGLPFLGSTDCRPMTFQQLQFLVGYATVDMKMQTLVISMEMQIPDINTSFNIFSHVRNDNESLRIIVSSISSLCTQA